MSNLAVCWNTLRAPCTGDGDNQGGLGNQQATRESGESSTTKSQACYEQDDIVYSPMKVGVHKGIVGTGNSLFSAVEADYGESGEAREFCGQSRGYAP